MTRIGAYTPETAKMIHDVVSYLKNSGFTVQRPGREGQFVPPPAPIYVRNDTGEEIPAFACLQTDGTVEDGGQNYVKVVKPADVTGSAGWYLFNGIAPIEIGGYGVAHDGPLVRMLTNGSAVTNGAKWAPVVSAFTVAPAASGIFTAVGADDIGTDVMRGFCQAMPTVTQTYVTDIRVSGTTLQYKTRDALIFPAGDESDWTTWHTGEDCTT